MENSSVEQEKRKLPYVPPVVTIATSGELNPRVGSVATTPEGMLTPGSIFTGSGS